MSAQTPEAAARAQENGGRLRRGKARGEAAPVIEASRRMAGCLEVPVTLPAGLTTLSASSLLQFERCRESFFRNYVLREREIPNVRMAMGTAVSNAVTSHLIARRDHGDPGTSSLVDRVIAEFESEMRGARSTEKERRTGREAVTSGVLAYVEEILPLLDERGAEVLAVEREIRFKFPETEWSIVGYIDIETNGPIADVKFGKKHKSAVEAHYGLQGSLYILGRFLEGADPSSGFVFHSGRTTKPREGNRWRIIPEDQPSPRTERQLEQLMARIAAAAREMVRCAASGDWGFSTEGWWCSPTVCPFHSTCPAGGLH
jgi:PD-(D/E)XK nuclease superfamily